MDHACSGRSIRRSLAAMMTLVLMGAVAACGEGPPKASTSHSPSPSSSSSATATPGDDASDSGEVEYRVQPGSRRAAQRALDAAEKRFIRAGTAHYDVSWFAAGDVKRVVTADVNVAAGSSSQTLIEPDGASKVENRYSHGDIWGRVTTPGKPPQRCWFHQYDQASEAAGGGLLAGVMPLIEPRAIGSGAQRDTVVVKLSLAEAMAILGPKLTSRIADVEETDSVRALISLDNGTYRSLEFDATAVIDKLAAGGLSEVADQLKGFDAQAGQTWTVLVAYSRFGKPVTVEAPEETVELSEMKAGKSYAELCR